MFVNIILKINLIIVKHLLRKTNSKKIIKFMYFFPPPQIKLKSHQILLNEFFFMPKFFGKLAPAKRHQFFTDSFYVYFLKVYLMTNFSSFIYITFHWNSFKLWADVELCLSYAWVKIEFCLSFTWVKIKINLYSDELLSH